MRLNLKVISQSFVQSDYFDRVYADELTLNDAIAHYCHENLLDIHKCHEAITEAYNRELEV